MSEATKEPQGSPEKREFLFCPYCTGGNLLDATRCRWCRKPLGLDIEPQPEPLQETEPAPEIPLEQVYCPHCKGGNPPGERRCIWCKRPLNLEAAAAELPPSRNLIESYKHAVIAPSLLRYTALMSNASWRKIWLSLGIAAVASGIAGTVRNVPHEPSFLLLAFPGLIIGTVIAFFVNTLLLYGLAKLFGGKGRTSRFGPDFLVHAYLMVLVFTPYSILNDIVSMIPTAGSCIALLLSIYQLYLSYKVIQVSRLLDPSSARATIIAMVVVEVFLVLGIFAIALAAYFVLQPGLFSRLG